MLFTHFFAPFVFFDWKRGGQIVDFDNIKALIIRIHPMYIDFYYLLWYNNL